MRVDIVNFCRRVNKRYGLETIYVPENDVYSIRFRGRGVHNFNSRNFYEIPKRYREVLVGRILKVGLNHQVGEKSMQNQVYIDRRLGKKII